MSDSKIQRAVIVRESACDICGALTFVAGWMINEPATALKKGKAVRSNICAACAGCLINVLNQIRARFKP